MIAPAQDTPRSMEAPAPAGAIVIRPATLADNDELLALTRVTPMPGAISLRIDRDPDFFALLRMRGEALVYVATCDGRVIGSISGTIHEAYVNGVAERIAYVGDLKVHPEFAGRRISVRLIATLQEHLKTEGIDLTYNVVAKGNDRVSKFTAKKHVSRGVVALGDFINDEILASPFARRSKRYSIEEPTSEELPEIVRLIDQVRRKRMFGRHVTMAELERVTDASRNLNFAKILVAREGGCIKATLTLEDTGLFKRNVLMSAPALLRAVLGVLRLAKMAIPKLKVPRVGEPLAMLYVRYMACEDGHEEAFVPLLAEARAEAFRRGSSFVSVGLHENDPYRAVVSGLPRFTFRSVAVSNSIFTTDRVRDLIASVPFEDFALV
jgi:ribosomal protein S18 acetylase RimI-like enzyme